MNRAVRSLALLAGITALLVVIATPITAAAADNAKVAGDWSLTVETPNGTGSPTVTFKQDGGNLTGTYKGRSGESELKGTVTGNDIKWSVTIHPQGQDLVIEYSGTVDGDTMKGKVTFGSMGEGTFTGKRGAAAAPAPAPAPSPK
jgi:hypothetical protein